MMFFALSCDSKWRKGLMDESNYTIFVSTLPPVSLLFMDHLSNEKLKSNGIISCHDVYLKIMHPTNIKEVDQHLLRIKVR
jgi:hypothetical protein